jgi:membrane fusion protein, multidrug efflux system
MATENKSKIIRPIVIGIVLLVAGYFGFKKVSYMLNNEDTENSQLESNIVPAMPKVGGWVTTVLVKDNQKVKIGDTLVKIDDREMKIRVQQAEVALKSAEANISLIASNASTANANVNTSDANFQAQNAGIETANAQIATANANVEATKIRIWKATQDFNRYKVLFEQKSVTAQQFDAIKAEKESAESTLDIAQKQALSAQAALDVVKKQANIGSAQKSAAQTQVGSASRQVDVARIVVEQRKAELELAKLQLSYTVVTAPLNGQVSRKNVQIGQLVNAGQPLMSIVDDASVWVIANFKETQLGKMQIGDKVRVKVDAYKDSEFEGTIESFSGATGAKFSLLPPDNSTGNFVKVVQRVPTKILITDSKTSKMPLRAGMSVEVIVPVK